MNELQDFFNKLNGGPAVLFLGQNYLRLDTGGDPFLAEIQAKFGGSATGAAYDLLFEGIANQSGDSALAWMTERCRRLLSPEWLRTVAGYQWSSVYSSAIDTIWLSAFRNEWRDIWPIFEEHYFPRDPRNRRILHCTFLFGSINQTEQQQRAPLSKFELLSRKPIAVNLARRLPDILTPLGTLVIEGYAGDEDWLSISDFYPVIQMLNPKQVHLFSTTEQLAQNEIINQLVQSGKVILHAEGLAWILQQGIEQGLVKMGPVSELGEEGRQVILQTGNISIPRDLWNKVCSSATVLDADVLASPPPMSEDARYWEFRRFLFESGIRPVWSGYANGFAFKRHFEEPLHELVLRRLAREATSNQPIILHGQTGTGKTVALGRLAFDVAKSGKYPVFFIERKIQRPVYADLDQCCQWLEDHGAEACLVVWDGMLQPNEYYDVQGYFTSRGRKIVLVGSTYKLQAKGDNYFAVPDCLTTKEAPEFISFLAALNIPINEHLREAVEKRDTSYLVALYRLLPPTRPRIRTGVVEELEQTEKEIENAVISLQTKLEPVTTLAQALINAGIIDEAKLDEIRRGAATAKIRPGDVQELVDLVMVPGRFGINIPIELLVHAWGKSDFSDIGSILRDFDIFRSSEDYAGRILVGPRQPLEAWLLVQARIGTVEAEVAIITKLIETLRPVTSITDESDGVNFVVELVRAIGPQGSEKARFRPFFPRFATALRQLRDTRNIRSPRLMLQEGNLLREWVTLTSQAGQVPEEASATLDAAQTILQDAMGLLDDNRRNQALRESIATELATTLGAQTVYLIRRQAKEQEIVQAFQRTKEAIRSARHIDFTQFHPVDVLIWVTTAMVQSASLTDVERIDAIADALDAIQTVDTELIDALSLEQFHKRMVELGDLLGDQKMSDSSFEKLLAMGSTAGYYIRALDTGGSTRDITGVSESLAQQYQNAWQYLEKHRTEIVNDPRCLNLLFDYWWLSRARQSLFSRERSVVPFNENDWSYCLQLMTQLKSLPGSYRNLSLSFLEALSVFHLNHPRRAFQLFREVESESYILRGKRRIIRFYLAGDPNGKPRVFHGAVRMVEADGRRGQVFVDELGQRIPFFPADFGQPNIGDSLGEFHIAFNFLGPVADSTLRYSA